MLIVEIALGIVLGIIMLKYLPQILETAGVLFTILLILGAIILLFVLVAVFYKEVLIYLIIPFVFLFGFAGTLPLYLMSKDKLSIAVSDFADGQNMTFAILLLGILNFFLAALVYGSIPLSSVIYEWSFQNGYKDSLDLFAMSVFMLWPWIFVFLLPGLKKDLKQQASLLIQE